MKKVKIIYNPYLLKTTIQVDGKMPKPNSKLNFGKLRIQEWSAKLAQILLEECSDRNFYIEFTGTQSDFDDLKEILKTSKNFQWTFAATDIQDSVIEVEKKVDELFNDIQNGPIEQLRDNTIKEAFRKAKNSEFEVNVVATMSSGKSTLINALLGKKLMPVANMATTATIVKIIDTEQDNYSAKAYDAKGKLIKEDSNITYRTMKEWNKDTNISSIEILGRIPCVKSVGMRLVLVDTPGPNNSRDENHKRMTYDMLADSDKSLVLFVMNATQLNVDDQKNLMDFVCECMEKGGKQSRERYIFAINKMDSFNPEDDDPSEALNTAKDVLLDNKITAPNLFPVSAQAALECRTDVSQSVLPIFIPRLAEYPELKFDTYYEYNNLPLSVKYKIEGMLQSLEQNDRVEIHSGIVSIEQAIGLYIDKYARAIKVKDLVDSFNDRLNELKAVATLQAEIRQNKDKKVQLDKQIDEIKEKIESSKSAQTLSKIIDRKDLSGNVTEEIDEYINVTKTKIEKIIFKHSKSTRVRKSEAIRQIDSIVAESSEILNQLDSRAGRILEKAYKSLMSDIIMEYQNYLDALGITSVKNDFGLRPLDFVAEELADVNRIMSNNVTVVDEGHNETRHRQVRGKKKTNWFWTPWNWFTERYETETEIYTVHIPNNVEYVDMSSVVKEYMKPLQTQLIDAKRAVTEHAESESVRIKSSLKNYLNKINLLLQKKLEELKISTDVASQTQKEIEIQESNLQWMKSIITRVNELINF